MNNVLGHVGLGDFHRAFPHGLSDSTAQRVALTHTLTNDPQLLVPDGPLGKLGSLTRLTMQNELVTLW